MEKIICGNCKFWQYEKNEEGFCKRYAPKPIIMVKTNNPLTLVIPTTKKDSWCGEAKECD